MGCVRGVGRLDAVEVAVEDAGVSSSLAEEDEGVAEGDEPAGNGDYVVIAFVAGLGVVVEDEGLNWEVSIWR